MCIYDPVNKYSYVYVQSQRYCTKIMRIWITDNVLSETKFNYQVNQLCKSIQLKDWINLFSVILFQDW